MKSKIFKVFVVLFFIIGITACSLKKSSKESGDSQESKYDQVVYAYATFNNIPDGKSLRSVEEAINKITREKIGAEITLKPISISEYTSKVTLSLQGGEKLDIFQSLGNFNTCLNTDMAYDITDIIDIDAPKTKELIGKDWLEACSYQGRLYGIPTYKPVVLTTMLIYRKDIAQQLNLDIDNVNSIDDVTLVAEKVKKEFPDIIPLAPVSAGSIGFHATYNNIDTLGDDYNSLTGVLFGNNYDVVDLYSTEYFKNKCEIARNWHNNGLILKDSATTTTTANEAMASGNYFGFIAGYSYPEEATAASMDAQCNGQYHFGAKIIGSSYLSTSDVNQVSWIIASTTDVPDAALKFLDLTYTDPDIVNLLIYGIEGRDYVTNDDGTVKYPEGQDAATVPYTNQLSCGILGNFFNMYLLEGTDPESLEWELEQNRTVALSPAMGFTFDSEGLETQYTAVKNVLSQYLPGLLCGSLDPSTEIPKLREDLLASGYEDILKAKQSQLDAWKETKGIVK